MNLNKIIIGCDIGGVVKDRLTDSNIEGSIQTIRFILSNKEDKYKLIFISKCKDQKRFKTNEWLKQEHLEHVPVFYCYELEEKLGIALRENVNIIIDDRIQVLRHFQNYPNILKIWFCSDKNKIDGLKNYQPDLFECLTIARDWFNVAQLVKNYRT